MKNEQIKNFLEYYINLEVPPEYAIMINGEWGSGKTYFVRNFLENISDKKIIFISLFGLKKTDDIDTEIFQQLHPVLGHKYVRFVGNILKNSIKFGTKIDFFGDESADGNVSINPSSFQILNEKGEGKELVFIFDDLERTDIPLKGILGYINYLVEQSEQKLLVLANEEKFEENENSDIYFDFKEKVIGKTFRIERDFDNAFESFLAIAKNSESYLYDNKKIIREIFETAEYRNLRHIRQAILDFEHLFNEIDEKYKKHNDFIKSFILEFFTISIESKYRTLKLEKESSEYFISLVSEEDNKKFDENFFKKYPFFLENSILPLSVWDTFIEQGALNSRILTESFEKSKYFLSEFQEEWVKLYHFMELEEEEFKEVLSKVEEKVKNNTYCTQVVLLHIGAILLHLSQKGLYDYTSSDILNKMKKAIDLCSSKQNKNWFENPYLLSSDHAIGLGYYGAETKEFQELQSYLVERNKKIITISLKLIPEEIFQLIENPTKHTANRINEILSNASENYRENPIFDESMSQRFVNGLININNRYIRDTIIAFRRRYNKILINNDFIDELNFWKKVKEQLQQKEMQYKGTIKGIWITATIKMLNEDILKRLTERLEVATGIREQENE